MTFSAIRFDLLTLFLVVTFAALVAFWLRPKQVQVEYALEAILSEYDAAAGRSNSAAQVRVTNRSWNAVWYFAADTVPPDPAVVSVQKLGDEWRLSGSGDLPRKPFKLAHRESFVLEVPLDTSAEAFRVVMDFSTDADGSRIVERSSGTIRVGTTSQYEQVTPGVEPMGEGWDSW